MLLKCDSRYPRRSRLTQESVEEYPAQRVAVDQAVSGTQLDTPRSVGPHPASVHSSAIVDQATSVAGLDEQRSHRAPEGTGPEPSLPARSGHLFYGESNFLTLVPRPPPGDEAEPPQGTWRNTRMSFPIPRTPQSTANLSAATPQSTAHIQANVERYLRDGEALATPDIESCLPAIQAYFDWFHPCFPVLDRAQTRQQVASRDISPILFQAILFIGATYCDDATIASMGFQDRLEAKMLLYTRARLLFHADVEKDGTTLIQALFLLSFWRGGPSDPRDVRYWLGVVITFAESYGFHRSYVPPLHM